MLSPFSISLYNRRNLQPNITLTNQLNINPLFNVSTTIHKEKMTISQFYILSARGDKIISRDCKYEGSDFNKPIPDRYDIVKGSEEIFFRKVKSVNSEETIPFFVSFVDVLRNEGFEGGTRNSVCILKEGKYVFCTHLKK